VGSITADDVRTWLKIEPGGTDDPVIDLAVAATNAWIVTVPYVADLDPVVYPPDVAWPDDVQLAGTMLAARWYRRRNSPSGIEAYTDNVIYLPRRDGDVDLLLHLTRPAAFETVGVRAVDDVRDVNTPCAYLIPPEGAFRFDRGRLTITWVVYLVVANTGAPGATRALSALVDKVTGLFSFTTFTRDAVSDPNGGDALPALRLSWTSVIEIGDTP
jgi:hypothetical protein